MSYDISLSVGYIHHLMLMKWHDFRGGTYGIGLDVTDNYAAHFKQAFGGDRGIRSIFGLTAEASVPVLSAAIQQLQDDDETNYWAPTTGNARRALVALRVIALQAMDEGHGDAIWGGD